MDTLLEILQEEAEARATSAARGRAWPCRRGCDSCCRRLADVPRLSEREWESLQVGLEKLSPGAYEDVGRRVRALPGSGPMICPLLDSEGACLVYEHRPLACRAYGFYRERDKGLYCHEIEARVDRGDYEDVIWGNAEGLEQRQAQLGEMRDLREWWSLSLATP